MNTKTISILVISAAVIAAGSFFMSLKSRFTTAPSAQVDPNNAGIKNSDDKNIVTNLLIPPEPPGTLPTKTSEEGAIGISVTPQKIDGGWFFDISFDTHSVELNHDIASSVFLIGESGKEYSPISVEADSPGGHHRFAKLGFAQDTQTDNSVTLIIKNIGLPERVFSW